MTDSSFDPETGIAHSPETYADRIDDEISRYVHDVDAADAVEIVEAIHEHVGATLQALRDDAAHLAGEPVVHDTGPGADETPAPAPGAEEPEL
jgi:hypothetical protein